MTTIPHYRTELKELIKVYDYEEVAAALGVTVRSLYNYTNDKNPMAANKNVIKKISETFLKHKKGEPINKKEQSENEPNGDYKDKYIALLEKQLADKEGIERELQELKNLILTSRQQYDRRLKDVHAYLQIIYQRSIIHFSRMEQIELQEVEDDMDKKLAVLLDVD